MSKAKSLTLVGIAYLVAIAVGAAWLVWGVHTGRLWLDTLVADVLGTLVIFAFSRAYRNSSFYDAYWSVIPPVLLWGVVLVLAVWSVVCGGFVMLPVAVFAASFGAQTHLPYLGLGIGLGALAVAAAVYLARREPK